MGLSKKIASAFLELGVEDQNLDSGLKQTKQKVSRGFADIGQAAAAGFAAFGLSRLISFGDDEARKMEVARIGFEVLTGSAEQANKTLTELKQFSDFTPFEGEEVKTAGKKLLAAGVDVDFLTEKLQFLGDASAAVDANLNEVAQIYSKIRNQNKLTGETFEQLAERSINLAPVIQEQLGITADKFLDMRSAGEITTDIVENAFRQMSSEGGAFFGAMEKLSQSMEGRLSTLRTRWADIARVIGESVMPVKKAFVEIAIRVLDMFLALDPAIQKIVGVMLQLAPAVLGVAAAFKIMQLAGISAGTAIRGALFATGIGVLLPLIGLLIGYFIDLASTIDTKTNPVILAFKDAGEKLFKAWEVFGSAFQTIVDAMTVAFSGFFEMFGLDVESMKEGFMGFIVAMIDGFANFVLNAAEWFKVIVDNWGTVVDLLGSFWEVTWRSILDILGNSLGFALDQLKAFGFAIIDVFSAIPAAIATIFAGGDVGDALNTLFDKAAANFISAQKQAFDDLFKPSQETISAQNRAGALLAQLQAEKAELEREREEAAAEEEVKKEEEDRVRKEEKSKPSKGDDDEKAGFIGLAELSRELQTMMLETDDDTNTKILGVNELQRDIQEKTLKVNEDILANQQNSIMVKVAGR